MSTKTKTASEMLRQVLLVEEGGSGQDVFWIRNEVAKVGARVRDEAGTIWRVAEIYNAKRFEDVDLQIRVWAEFAETLDGHR